MQNLFQFVILPFGSWHFQPTAKTNRTMKLIKKTRSIYTFQTREFGPVELMVSLRECVGPDGVLYGEWIPELYFVSGDYIADFQAVGEDRKQKMSLREEQRQWKADCVYHSNFYLMEAWQPMWLRSEDARLRVQRGIIWFKDHHERDFCVYHIGPIADAQTGQPFADRSQFPMLQLITVETVEIARDLGANESIKDNGVFETDYKSGTLRIPALYNHANKPTAFNV